MLFALGYWGTQWYIETQLIWEEDRELIAVHGQGGLEIPELDEQPISPPSMGLKSPVRFATAQDSGLDWQYEHGDRGEFHLAETLGGGIGVLDFDRDGWLDITATDGGDPLTWPENQQNRVGLFRQIGPERFTNVSGEARLHWTGYGHGCCVGDVDSDGFDDLYVTGYQSACLFLNVGDGTFRNATDEAGLALDWWAATAAFGDLDLDGDLDLYVTGYADVSRDLPAPYCESGGRRIHCHPHHYDAIPDAVYENVGDGTFRDRTESSGVGEQLEYGLGVMIVDLDDDRIPEIFVANDGDRNLLFRWVGNWHFEEVGLPAGVAFNSEGGSMGSMGIACADFDADGLLDLLVTNFSHERNVLYSNAGELMFYDLSLGSELAQSSRSAVGWGAIPLDADLDGNIDLFVANGHVTDMPGQDYAQLPAFFRGTTGGKLTAVVPGGEYFTTSWHARGAVGVEITGDGRTDLIVSHIRDQLMLLRNESVTTGAAARVQLVGVESNRSGANVRLEWTRATDRHASETSLSAGYLSSSSAPPTISWPTSKADRQLRITWPSGQSQIITAIGSNASLVVVEGHASSRLAE